jgi:hypothetical protein
MTSGGADDSQIGAVSPQARPPGRSAVATNPSMAPPFMSARAESALCCAPPFIWLGSW